MVADAKKVQTMINVLAESATEARAAVARMKAVRAKFNAHNLSVVGTPLEGNVNSVNSALNALDAETSKAIWTQMIAASILSHRNKALD